jgi:hypothetical protein
MGPGPQLRKVLMFQPVPEYASAEMLHHLAAKGLLWTCQCSKGDKSRTKACSPASWCLSSGLSHCLLQSPGHHLGIQEGQD